MPNIVIRPAPVRNIRGRGMQSDRVRLKRSGCICSKSTARSARMSWN